MADFSELSTTDDYITLLQDISDRITALEQDLSVGSHTGLAFQAKRWNDNQNMWESWNGGSWSEMASEYNINVHLLQDKPPSAQKTGDTIALRKGDGRIEASAPSVDEDVVRELEARDASYPNKGTVQRSVLPGPTTNDLGAVEKATPGEAENGATDKFPDAAGVVHAIHNNKAGDANKLDGQDSTAYGKLGDNETVTGDWNFSGQLQQGSSDVITQSDTGKNSGIVVEEAARADNGNPPGMLAFWPTNTPPAGWLVRDGAEVSRTTYADLFAVIGTNYGNGDGSTTFNLPDDRDEFMRAVGPGRAVGTKQNDEFRSHDHPFNGDVKVGGAYPGIRGDPSSTWKWVSGNVGRRGGSETRPRNRAYLPIIKY